jgi:hypothetical protein
MGEIKGFYGVPDEIPTDLRSLIEAFPDWLTEAAKRGGLLLVLDALNQLEDRGKVRVSCVAHEPCTLLNWCCRCRARCTIWPGCRASTRTACRWWCPPFPAAA